MTLMIGVLCLAGATVLLLPLFPSQGENFDVSSPAQPQVFC
jgi:hypothetical protein